MVNDCLRSPNITGARDDRRFARRGLAQFFGGVQAHPIRAGGK
jgi:hypothetical protein